MISLPVVIALFAALSVGLGAGVMSYRLHHLAHEHARVLSLEGDPAYLTGVPHGATSRTWTREDLVCVEYRSVLDKGVLVLFPLTLAADACALAPADE